MCSFGEARDIDLNQSEFSIEELAIPPELMLNIDETSILLDPGDCITALTNEEASNMLNRCHLSVSVNVKSEREDDNQPTTKKRFIQMFAITTPKPELKAIICQIYDRNVTEVNRYKVGDSLLYFRRWLTFT